MLNWRGRKLGVRPSGRSTLRKSDGAPMVSLRLVLFLVAVLARLDAFEARFRPSAMNWLVRLVREAGRTSWKSNRGAGRDGGCSQQISVYLLRASKRLVIAPSFSQEYSLGGSGSR